MWSTEVGERRTRGHKRNARGYEDELTVLRPPCSNIFVTSYLSFVPFVFASPVSRNVTPAQDRGARHALLDTIQQLDSLPARIQLHLVPATAARATHRLE